MKNPLVGEGKILIFHFKEGIKNRGSVVKAHVFQAESQWFKPELG